MATLPANIETLRKIKADCQAARLRWKNDTKTATCDLFTASAIVAVFDALIQPESKDKLAEMVARDKRGFIAAANFSFKHIK